MAYVQRNLRVGPSINSHLSLVRVYEHCLFHPLPRRRRGFCDGLSLPLITVVERLVQSLHAFYSRRPGFLAGSSTVVLASAFRPIYSPTTFENLGGYSLGSSSNKGMTCYDPYTRR